MSHWVIKTFDDQGLSTLMTRLTDLSGSAGQDLFHLTSASIDGNAFAPLLVGHQEGFPELFYGNGIRCKT